MEKEKETHLSGNISFKSDPRFKNDLNASEGTKITMPLDIFEKIRSQAELNQKQIEEMAGAAKSEYDRVNQSLLFEMKECQRLRLLHLELKDTYDALKSKTKHTLVDIAFEIVLYILAIIGVVAILIIIFR